MPVPDFDAPEVVAWMEANPLSAEAARAWAKPEGIACACLGTPHDMAGEWNALRPCVCQIRMEQARRMLGL